MEATSQVKQDRDSLLGLLDQALSGQFPATDGRPRTHPTANSHAAPAVTQRRSQLLSPVEVAQLWFHTASPTPDQLKKVYTKMKAGAIQLNDPHAPPGRWTTTEESLATFLASRRAMQEAARRGVCRNGKEMTAAMASADAASSRLLTRSDEVLRGVYRNAWHDYFEAVMCRRRHAGQSRAFTRAVIAGQGLVVAGIAMAFIVTLGLLAPGKTHEQRSIAAHLASAYPWHTIDQWHAPQVGSDGKRFFRVQYRYREGEQASVVHTDRTYVVTEAGVSELASNDD